MSLLSSSSRSSNTRKSLFLRSLPASIALFILVGCGGSSGSDSTNGQATDRIVYIKSTTPEIIVDGTAKSPVTSEMYVMNTNGTGRTRVNETGEDVYYQSPSLSQDGSKIVVLSSRDDCGVGGCYFYNGYPYPRQVWVMNADGSQSKRLTSSSNTINSTVYNHISSPVLSPDGSKVFYSDYDGFWVTDVNTLERKIIASESVGTFSLSPDGKSIAFSSYGPLTIMNADGTNRKQIGSNASFPAFSPDGLRIVYVEHPEHATGTESHDGTFWFSIVNADGTGYEKLNYVNDGSEGISSLAFSKDGKRVTFRLVKNTGGVLQFRLVTMNLDGSHQTSIPIDTSDY